MTERRGVATCRWAEQRCVGWAPLWLHALLRQWHCLRRSEVAIVSDETCSTCERWQPRAEDDTAPERSS